MRQALRRRIIRPLIELLRQGITPSRVAFTIALGITLGVTPVLGSTALLCTLAAMLFRLNLPAIQLVNWLVYPLQIALLVPFLRIGAWMFGDRSSEISVAYILQLVRADVVQAIASLWTATMQAVAAWLVLGSVFTVLLYLLLLPVIRGLWRRVRADAEVRLC